MRYPLWIVNSSLLGFFIISIGFLFFSNPRVPKQVPLNAKEYALKKPAPAPQIDVSQIYNNDLFNTYFPTIAPAEEQNYVKPLPSPPQPSHVSAPEDPEHSFLPALNITLRGAMVVDDATKSAAIIVENDSQKESKYRIGDMVEDAELIRILDNRVILIRSNGQQETLYLSEKEIDIEPNFANKIENWQSIVKQVAHENYYLDGESFIEIIPSLAQCIDTFDLTTVYQNGKNVGCRLGGIEKGSLGEAMGLQSYDIITAINDISTTTTNKRFEIYNNVVSLKLGDTCTLAITRDNAPITLVYTLHDLHDPLTREIEKNKKDKAGIFYGPSSKEIEKEQVNLLEQKYKFAPTEQQLRIEQKKVMLKQGKRK